MMRLSLAKRVSILSLCLIGFSLPWTAFSVSPVQANLEPNAIALGDPVQEEKQARQLVEWLGAKQYDKVIAALSPQLKPLWTAEKLQKVWESQVTDHTGPFKRIVKTKVLDAINANLVIVTVEFEKVTDDVIVTFNRSGQIVAADFPEFRSISEIGTAFVTALANKDYGLARGFLHPFLKAEVFPTRVQGAWENLLKRTGPVRRIVGTQVRKGSGADGVDLVLVTIQFEKLTDTLILVFDDQKQIVNVDFPLGN
ncbi:DUF3887 domain-containing protein [Microcystis sp. LEGE 00066]|uniref:DUF3887 domain-containing protein n=1 Tax=Microcystis sp. LEGE 00066 TaxID=1828685 RepID=UPI00188060C4|nr:DUF3887 domain-containing protein [Microcystis sp. LEGE 00066]MBE9262700.1 DUF3887 domain-containing protein [Microcystis sp. LEGE 00066]